MRGCYADCVVRKMTRDTGLCSLSRSSSVERLQDCLQECLPVLAGDTALFKSHYRCMRVSTISSCVTNTAITIAIITNTAITIAIITNTVITIAFITNTVITIFILQPCQEHHRRAPSQPKCGLSGTASHVCCVLCDVCACFVSHHIVPRMK